MLNFACGGLLMPRTYPSSHLELGPALELCSNAQWNHKRNQHKNQASYLSAVAFSKYLQQLRAVLRLRFEDLGEYLMACLAEFNNRIHPRSIHRTGNTLEGGRGINRLVV